MVLFPWLPPGNAESRRPLPARRLLRRPAAGPAWRGGASL